MEAVLYVSALVSHTFVKEEIITENIVNDEIGKTFPRIQLQVAFIRHYLGLKENVFTPERVHLLMSFPECY